MVVVSYPKSVIQPDKLKCQCAFSSHQGNDLVLSIQDKIPFILLPNVSFVAIDGSPVWTKPFSLYGS